MSQPDNKALDRQRLPAHIAMIMDGNGRWAKKRLMNRVRGHEKGVETVRAIVRTCREIGIPALTLYAFSTENWNRPKAEVIALMAILKRFLSSEVEEMMEGNVRFNAIGELDLLPEDVREKIAVARERTAGNTGMCLNLALSYGSRMEILSMVRGIAKRAADGTIAPESITEEDIAESLYTRGLPDPDLLIRTSGEQRISNFLLWQIAYAEIAFTDTLWPDFTGEELIEILADYQSRHRRFGKV